MQPQDYDLVTLFNPDSHNFEIVYGGASYGVIEPGKAKRMPRFLADHALKHLIDQCLNTLEINTSSEVQRAQFRDKCVLSEEAMVNEVPKTQEEILRDQVQEMDRPSDLDIVTAKREAEGEAPSTPADGLAQLAPEEPILEPQVPVTQDVSPAPETVETVEVADPIPTVEEVPVTPVVEPTPEVIPAVEAAPENPPVGDGQPPVEAGDVTPASEPVVPVTEAPVSDTPPAPVEPTREELYEYAQSQNILDLNDPATKATLDAAPIPELRTLVQYPN